MKRITAVLITSAAILGCSYVGGANAATVPDCDAIAAAHFDKHYGSKYHGSEHVSIRDFIIDQDVEVCAMGASLKKDGATMAEVEKMLDEVRNVSIAKAVTERQKRDLIETVDRKREVFMAGYEGYSK